MNTTHSLEHFDNEELLALAQANMERKDLEGALLKLKIIVSRPDPLPAAWAMIARAYAQLQLFGKAEHFFERYVEAHPQAHLEQFELGMARFDAGKFPQALQTWDTLLGTQPTYPPAMFYKALLLARTGRSPEAKQLLEQLLKHIAIDNLYFERAKKLLQAIEANSAEQLRKFDSQSANEGADDGRLPIPNPYRTEH
jgi:tetratricopeptide (TPR) repeat protein